MFYQFEQNIFLITIFSDFCKMTFRNSKRRFFNFGCYLKTGDFPKHQPVIFAQNFSRKKEKKEDKNGKQKDQDNIVESLYGYASCCSGNERHKKKRKDIFFQF